MTFQSLEELFAEVQQLRRRLEPAFGPETSYSRSEHRVPSSGHCGAVSAIVYSQYGGVLLSTNVDSHSHWFNRLLVGDHWIDVDITGDQFGLPSVQVGPSGSLYRGSRVRQPSELNAETRHRALALASKAGIEELSCKIPPAT
jgi:hypothetical protein